MGLSDRQQRMLEFIREFIEEHQYPPTIREIGRAAGISSTKTAPAIRVLITVARNKPR